MADAQPPARGPGRHAVLLRLDPAVHDALARWAADDLRSLNAQVELLLRRALSDAGRLPGDAGPVPRRGRPRKPSPEPPGLVEGGGAKVN
ncbi:hypothetical protein [Nakamurella deserti]|uniref:hypothetical protein n=1 Tax=Nakamurella deserti TaxID=2164074 RepID=UPI000DBE415B|nr:hypothetical protein [Nakamurella deserti]